MAPYNPDTIPFDQWASRGALAFLPWTEHTPTPTNDPSNVTLPTPYVVLILGASRGIGAHIAHAYTRAGASGLVLAARRTSGLQTTAATCREIDANVEVESVECDITDAGSVEKLAEAAWRRFGRLDVVVVNSGVAGPVAATVTEDDLEMVKVDMDVNYAGTFYAAKHLVPLLLRTEGGAKAFVGINTGACEFACYEKDGCFRSLTMKRTSPYRPRADL